MIHHIHAPAELVAHNQTARTAYLIHESHESFSEVTVIQPDLGVTEVRQLGHDAARFTHHGTLTAIHGLYGASVFNGTEMVFSTHALGPHRFIGGKFLSPDNRPDIRGFELSDGLLGNLKTKAYFGHAVAAATFRNTTLGFFDGAVFSAWGAVESPRPEACSDPRVLGEVYVHPHLRMISVAVAGGWLYSVDDAQRWRFLEQAGWPIKLSDREVLLVGDKSVRLR